MVLQSNEPESECVNLLVKQLCDNLLEEFSESTRQHLNIDKLKSKAHQILLKKNDEIPEKSNDSIIEDIHREFDIILFELRAHARNDPLKLKQYEDLEKAITFLSKDSYLRNETVSNLIKLLLYLREPIDHESSTNQKSRPFLKPKPFALGPEEVSTNTFTTIFKTDGLFTSTFKSFKTEKFLSENPYLPQIITTGKWSDRPVVKFPRPCQPIPIDDATSTTNTPSTCSLTSTFSSNTNFTNFRLLRPKFFRKNLDMRVEESTCKELKILKKPQVTTSTTTLDSIRTYFSSQMDLEGPILNWNWEHLGRNKVKRSQPFASECKESSFALRCTITNGSSSGTLTANIVPVESFMADLKALTVGIQSDSFFCDDNFIFHIVPNITISNILPDIMEDFVAEFLECGTCFKRMQIMCDDVYQQTHNGRSLHGGSMQNCNGFIYKTFCSAVGEYLIQFRQYVLSCPEKSVLSLYSKLKEMMDQVCSLALILAVHPKFNTKPKPPTGSQFLGYLYKEIGHVTKKDCMLLLVYIFKRCSTVYFKHLQKWIYHGVLDDPCNEIFIGFVDHYRPQTKYFYDKAYFVRKDFVPGFFQGFEDKILQCGKYAQILKAYKPNHPLFNMKYPQISVCLSFNEIRILEIKCKNYYLEVEKVCGKTVTVKDVFNRKVEKKNEFLKMVLEKSEKNMQKWLLEYEEARNKENEEKRKRLEEIQAQIKDNEKHRIEQRKADIALELKCQREMEEYEDRRLVTENLALQKRLDYYKELHELVDQKNKKVEFNESVVALHSSNDESVKDKESVEEIPLSGKPSSETLSINLGSPNTDTEFESCLGDDDDRDENGTGDKESIYEDTKSSPESIGEMKETENDNNNVETSPTLKKSASDILNSNELEITELTRNRNKILGSTIFDTAPELHVSNGNLTEAQKIKLKILDKEYDLGTTKTTLSKVTTTAGTGVADVNSNIVIIPPTPPQSEESDLQRNRRKMMQSESTFANMDKEPIDRRNLCLDLNTERARNRNKVLSSEFDLPASLRVRAATVVDTTPMSTTSDTPISAIIEEQEQQETNELSTQSTHPSDEASNKNLILDIEKAKQEGISTMNGARTDLSTADNLQTPDDALNTAGLMVRQGFSFAKNKTNSKDEESRDLLLAIEKQSPATGNDDDDHQSVDTENLVENNPYRRCEELIASNFTCKPRYSVFKIKKPNSRGELYEASESDNDTDAGNQSILKKKSPDISGMITLTEFIQKSIIIPLNTQMEIMNNEIMRIFLEELDILSHFKSLRNYLLLMDGEFGSIVCDGLIGKLEKGAKPIELFNYQVLHTILENALGSSIIGNDKNAANLSFIVCCDDSNSNQHSNNSGHSGNGDIMIPDKFDLQSPSVLNCLSLCYRVQWPINLILNPETLQQYGNIFKYLLKVRRISWLLEDIQKNNLQELVKLYGNEILISPQYRHIQQIRHKFYHFINMLKNHITSNALQASWKQFKDGLLNVRTMEDLYRKHTIYIKKILFLCLLNKRSAEFNNAIENIFKITIRFVRNLKSREFKRTTDNKYFIHSKYERILNDEAELEKCIKFVIYLGNKIVRHGYQEEIGEFIGLINFNHYYSVD